MTRFVCKPVNLVFYRWAVSRANTFDHTGKHGRTVQACTYGIVRLLVGVCYPATELMQTAGINLLAMKLFNRVLSDYPMARERLAEGLLLTALRPLA